VDLMKWTVSWDGEVTADVAATPAQVWAVLSDPTRVGQWSHECHTATWVDGHSQAEVGAQFRGNNQVGSFRWSRTCTITELEPERLLVYRTSGGLPPDSTEWSFRLEPVADGTRITQSFRILKFPRLMELVTVLFNPPHRDRSVALRGDLTKLGEVSATVEV
jgi:uncharacterized protein YndB with AHSA1/START domain